METGTGASITFSSSFFAKARSISWTGISREAIDMTTLATTGGRDYVPGDLYDLGQLEVEGLFDAETDIPIASAAETVTVTLPSTGAGNTSTWACSGFMTGFEWTAPLEGAQTYKATLKLSGDKTVTA